MQTVVRSFLDMIRGWWAEHGESVKIIINGFLTAIQTVFQTIVGVWNDIWITHGEDVKTAFITAWEAIQSVVEVVLEVIGSIIDAAAAAIQGDWDAFGEHLQKAWDTAWEAIKGLLEGAWEKIKIVVSGGVDVVKGLLRAGSEALVGIINGLADRMVAAGRAIVDKIKEGIAAAWGELTGWFQDRLNDLGNLLPFSEPKDPRSPLRGLSKSGEAFVSNWMAGFERAMPRLDAAVAGFAGQLSVSATAPAGNGGGGQSVVIYGGLTLNGVQDADSLLQELQNLTV